MNKEEAARYLRVSARTLDRYTREGRLHPSFRRESFGVVPADYDEAELKAFKDRASLAVQAKPLSADVLSTLACPHCMRAIEVAESGGECAFCQIAYPRSASGALDLRLQAPKRYLVEVLLPPSPNAPVEPPIESRLPLEAVDQSGGYFPFHIREWYSKHWPQPSSADAIMIDLGCGSVLHRDEARKAGFEYLGVDFDSPHADILIDAHSLPFGDCSFEFMTAYAVLEHLRFPHVAFREARRVLKPQGTLIGTVSFLEPFHMNSYYHHTHLGTLNTLHDAGFRVVSITPSGDWNGLVAQASMSLYPGMPENGVKLLTSPLVWLNKLWWKAANRRTHYHTEDARIRAATGAFNFCAIKV